jgi:hypothetical protein
MQQWGTRIVARSETGGIWQAEMWAPGFHRAPGRTNVTGWVRGSGAAACLRGFNEDDGHDAQADSPPPGFANDAKRRTSMRTAPRANNVTTASCSSSLKRSSFQDQPAINSTRYRQKAATYARPDMYPS